MPSPANKRHGFRVIGLPAKTVPGDGIALNSMSHPDYIDQLLMKAVKAASWSEAEGYARAALTSAQAICQQQFNQPKRKRG